MLDTPSQHHNKAYYDPAHLSNRGLDDKCDEGYHEEGYCGQSSEMRDIRHVQMASITLFASTRLLPEHARETRYIEQDIG